MTSGRTKGDWFPPREIDPDEAGAVLPESLYSQVDAHLAVRLLCERIASVFEDDEAFASMVRQKFAAVVDQLQTPDTETVSQLQRDHASRNRYHRGTAGAGRAWATTSVYDSTSRANAVMTAARSQTSRRASPCLERRHGGVVDFESRDTFEQAIVKSRGRD